MIETIAPEIAPEIVEATKEVLDYQCRSGDYLSLTDAIEASLELLEIVKGEGPDYAAALIAMAEAGTLSGLAQTKHRDYNCAYGVAAFLRSERIGNTIEYMDVKAEYRSNDTTFTALENVIYLLHEGPTPPNSPTHPVNQWVKAIAQSVTF